MWKLSYLYQLYKYQGDEDIFDLFVDGTKTTTEQSDVTLIK